VSALPTFQQMRQDALRLLGDVRFHVGPELCPHLPDPRAHPDVWVFGCAKCETHWESKATS
jgi:hypothetical protein